MTVNSADAAASLTLSSANADVQIASANGALAIGGSFTMSAGEVDVATSTYYSGTVYVTGALNNDGNTLNGSQSFGALTLAGGTVEGSTATSAGLTIGNNGEFYNGGTLSGVTYEGTLTLTSYSVSMEDGSTVVGASGSGAGTIDVGPASLDYEGSQTVSNVTINLGRGAGANPYLDLYDKESSGDETLTLAATVTVNVDCTGSAQISTGSGVADVLVNNGVINQAGGSLYINQSYSYGTAYNFTKNGTLKASGSSTTLQGHNFTNSGTLDVGDSFSIDSNTFATTSTSVINVAKNETLDIAPTAAWTNLGLITLDSGSVLDIGGSTSTAGLGSITNSGGTVYRTGVLNDNDDILDGSQSLGTLTLASGTIDGGTATSAGLVIASNGIIGGFTYGGTLNDVTYEGPLSLTSYAVHMANDSTVVGASGSGAGTINVGSADLFYDGTQTVSNVTINLGGGTGDNPYLEQYDEGDSGYETLTLASTTTVNADAYDRAEIYAAAGVADAVVTDGVINQTGGTLFINQEFYSGTANISLITER